MLFYRVFWVLALFSQRVVSALPAGFEDEEVVDVGRSVVDISFAGKDTMLIITDLGILFRYNIEDPDSREEVALDITDKVCDNGERGLVSVAVHPNFAENRWIYLYYTYNRGESDCEIDIENGPVNRCSRFVVNDDWTVDPSSELILFTNYGQKDKIHIAGDMEFGADGNLWVTTGDSGARSLKWAQDRSNLHGNIIRITDSGDIPADNPFLGEGTARCNERGKIDDGMICQEIYAFGLRNPFRFAMDPNSIDKVRFMISDVGGKVWEEINVGGEDHKGANYGWPMLEGPCDYDRDNKCDSFGDTASKYTDPVFWYHHDEEDSGCSVGLAIPPPDLNWPSPYSDPNSFFFLDFVFGRLYHVTEDTDKYCGTCTPPRAGFSKETFHMWERPVGLKFGPYIDHSSTNPSASQGLYYTARSDDYTVRRIIYKGGDNHAPTVSVTVNATNTLVGGVIQFNASETFDQDHEAESLTYKWEFGDGKSATGMVVSHRYLSAGTFRVSLTAVDPEGGMGRAIQEVSIGAPPSVEILSPSNDTKFAVGDVLTLLGTGMDHLGNPLNESTQLSWEVRQHHNNHYHPFLSDGTTGNNFSITEAPSPEDFFAASNSYLEILLTGSDNDGIRSTVSRFVMPKTVHLDFDTEPTGLALSLDEEVVTMPRRVLSWENHHLRVVVPENKGYVFKGWKQDAVAVKNTEGLHGRVIVVPANDSETVPLYVAMFEERVGAPTFAPTAPTFAPTATSIDPRNPPLDDDEVYFAGGGASSASTTRSMSWVFSLFFSIVLYVLPMNGLRK